MSWNLDIDAWTQTMFGQCELGDRRRTARLVSVARSVIENPSASFPDQMESWDRLKAAYRLFDAAGVTFDAIAAPHWEHTRQRAAGRTLVICDTTELDFGSQRQIEGVSRTGNGSGQGFLLHNAMMVNVDTMSIIGIGGQTIHYRPKEKIAKTENRSQRLARDRESQVWGRVIEQIGPPTDRAEYIYVCDRGADNFEVFCHLRQQKSDWVIRAKAMNREVLSHGGETLTLKALLSDLPLSGTYELHLRAREKQPARTAKIAVRTGSLLIPVPRHVSPWVRSLKPEPIATNVVWVREADAPEGTEPVEWVLFTSLPVATFEEAWTVIAYYEARWLVEEYHKALKSGCSVQERQLKSAPRLEAMIGLTSVVAVCLLDLKTTARREPDRAASEVVPRLWIQMLKAARRSLRRVHDLTVREFYRELAKLGGFIGRKSDGDPGWITIWRGWEKLQIMLHGAKLARKFNF